MAKMTKAEVRKFIGEPPVFDGPMDRHDLNEAYSYFTAAQTENSDFKRFVRDHLTSVGDKRSIHAIPDWEFRHIGVHFWIMENTNGTLPEDVEAKTWAALDDLVAKYATVPAADVAVVGNVQSAIHQKVDDIIEAIDVRVLDAFYGNDYKPVETSAKDVLSAFETKPMIASRVLDHYLPLYEEIRDAVAGTIEGYEDYGKRKLNRYLQFVESLIADIKSYIGVQKEVAPRRKIVRTRKKKNPGNIVAKVQYLSKSDDYGLTSEAPVKILGASQVWTFNVKYKKLTVYHADSPKGLTVAGTTIKGFDPEKSAAKAVRKPEVTLKAVLESGKIALRKIMPSLKTKESDPTGRLNQDTVIVRIIR